MTHRKLIRERDNMYASYLDYLKATHSRKYRTEESRIRRDIRRIRRAINAISITRRQLENM